MNVGANAARPYRCLYPPTLTVSSGLGAPTSRSRTPRYAVRQHGGLLSIVVELRFTGVELRFVGVESRFTGVELRFIGVESRFTGVELRFVGVESRFTGVESRSSALNRDSTRLNGCCPHPLCHPCPPAGEGKRAAPLSRLAGEGLGVRANTNRGDTVYKTSAIEDPPPLGSPCEQGEPNPRAVPLAKRGEPAGGGQL